MKTVTSPYGCFCCQASLYLSNMACLECTEAASMAREKLIKF